MPVLHSRRERYNVTGPDLLHGATPSLDAATSCRHNESLAQRVGVPRRVCARLERHGVACSLGQLRAWKQRINADRAAEPIGRAFDGGLCANSCDYDLLRHVHKLSRIRALAFGVLITLSRFCLKVYPPDQASA
jgi:hypothetical protein